MHSDHSLPFLARLAQQSSDDEIEASWAERTFPLVRTDDFDRNWKKVDDPMGIFVNGAGSRCRVVPQDHYGPQCRAKLMISGTEQDVLIPYEAIVFSKKKINSAASLKLPRRWRDIILKRDHYLYNEKPDGLYNQPTQGIYNKLNRPENIRLLTLYSALEEHPVIECSLSEASFESCPKYEALSYVWGKPLLRRSIQMNGTSFSVTENLEAARRQLRNRSGDAQKLWVDAVCINQSNNEERGSHVAQIDLP
ncbi:heterokaryon incompatibility protein-domain-containing protein [Xylaria acuta]|nr:heterokaryon incompatibility protein-domain-containing protein [Xylaria acuta]